MKLSRLTCLLLLAAPAAYAQQDNQPRWTERDVKKFCYSRAQQSTDKPASFERCMTDHRRDLTTPIQPEDAAELKKADALIAKKAAQKTADQNSSK